MIADVIVCAVSCALFIAFLGAGGIIAGISEHIDKKKSKEVGKSRKA